MATSSAVHTTPVRTQIDPALMDAFMGKFVGDLGAAMNASLVILGDKVGLYRAMDEAGKPLTSTELASLSGCEERYVREWLSAQAAGGYVTYDPATNCFSLSPEQAFALAREDSPAYIPGAFQIAAAMFKDGEKVAGAFRTGEGLGWHQHNDCLFEGTERFFRPNYAANLVANWLPSLTGVVDRLTTGGRVADVGCGHGASTILMAKSYPKSTFVGFDYHPASIEIARNRAAQSNLPAITFEVASASKFPGDNYDLVTFFDCLHDMGDPVGAARHVRQSLAPGGVWMIVEPFANDTLEGNLNPVGQVFYAASTMICTPASRSQEVGLALGAQAGERRMREVVMQAGFTHFRRAAQTPFNLVYEAMASLT